MNRFARSGVWFFLCALWLLPARVLEAKDSLYWNTNQNRVTADISSTELLRVLEGISAATGWKVFVEPETFHKVSVKFKDLPPGQALHLMLGDVNFALVPQTNAGSKLFVFRTALKRATQFVAPAKELTGAGKSKIIPNELIVRLKPGMKIDDLARALGAKVIGSIESLNAYRLQFDDVSATGTARGQLASNADVSSVEDNVAFDRPVAPQPVAGGAAPLQLNLNPPPDSGRVMIGLIDTAVQPLGNGLDQFLEKQVSLAGEAQLDPNAITHGTTMAETMLRTLQNLGNGSSSVTIKAYDIYGPSESGNTFVLARALAQAVNDGANPINLSLGGPSDSQMVRDLIKEARAKGRTFYAAVGNDGGPDIDFPAANSGATPVTAVDRNGQVVSYANKSGNSAVGALGTIVVPYKGQSWMAMGTSVSTAIVTATAGNLMERGPLSAVAANTRIVSGPTPTTLPGK